MTSDRPAAPAATLPGRYGEESPPRHPSLPVCPTAVRRRPATGPGPRRLSSAGGPDDRHPHAAARHPAADLDDCLHGLPRATCADCLRPRRRATMAAAGAPRKAAPPRGDGLFPDHMDVREQLPYIAETVGTVLSQRHRKLHGPGSDVELITRWACHVGGYHRLRDLAADRSLSDAAFLLPAGA